MNILIVEDEPHATDRLIKILAEVAPGKKLVGTCTSVKEALSWLENNPSPDLILSDVQLSDGLSFSLLESMNQKIPVIFISAFDQYALDAFRANGLHYLLKPVRKEELATAIARHDAKSNANQIPENLGTREPQSPADRRQKRFIVHVGSQMKLVEDVDIAYAFVEAKLTFIVTGSNEKFNIDLTLEKLEQSLDPHIFFRINRQFIVQLKSIEKMEPASKQRVELTLLPLTKVRTFTSFERTPAFKAWLLGPVK